MEAWGDKSSGTMITLIVKEDLHLESPGVLTVRKREN